MPEGDLVEWFGALPPLTQIFFGMFVFLTAIPIAILIVFQLVESLRSLVPRKRDDADPPQQGKQK